MGEIFSNYNLVEYLSVCGFQASQDFICLFIFLCSFGRITDLDAADRSNT